MLYNDDMMIFDTGKLEYQAQSPDEGALVTAARNFGFVFKVIYLIGKYIRTDYDFYFKS